MAKAMNYSEILGLNARSALFSYPYNTARGKAIAASKIKTYKVLKKAGVPTPEILAKFSSIDKVLNFDWKKLPGSFALKPSKGLGGEGIIVLKKKIEPESLDGEPVWISTQKEKFKVSDLKLHAIDILEGAYSIENIPDSAFVQEFVGRHKAFKKYAYRGTPDIRVIVFNKVPVMAMLRLPTKESGGRANLHQGAIAVGVDMATGITTKAYYHGKYIKYKPGTKRKLHGIKIPQWTKILEIAVRAAEAAGLGYAGIDVVLHPKDGPMVLEINSMPGLQIQLANADGLRKRLERVEGLEIKNAEHGVNVAKILFAERFADRVKVKEGVKTIGITEKVKVLGKNGRRIKLSAKIDTGATRTAIDRDLASSLGLLTPENIYKYKKTKSAFGQSKRPVIKLVYWLAGRKIETLAGVAKRSHLKFPLLIGQKDLVGFIIDPTLKNAG